MSDLTKCTCGQNKDVCVDCIESELRRCYQENAELKREVKEERDRSWNENELLRRELQELYAELDSLELAAIPGLIDRVQRRYRRLINAGLIEPEES